MFFAINLKFSTEEIYFIVDGNLFVSIKMKAYFKPIK